MIPYLYSLHKRSFDLQTKRYYSTGGSTDAGCQYCLLVMTQTRRIGWSHVWSVNLNIRTWPYLVVCTHTTKWPYLVVCAHIRLNDRIWSYAHIKTYIWSYACIQPTGQMYVSMLTNSTDWIQNTTDQLCQYSQTVLPQVTWYILVQHSFWSIAIITYQSFKEEVGCCSSYTLLFV